MILNTAIVFGKVILTLTTVRSILYDKIGNIIELTSLISGWLVIRLILASIAMYEANLVVKEVSPIRKIKLGKWKFVLKVSKLSISHFIG